ncbi:MAG: hypothetical protein J6T15_04955 [Bacilli bacterium]|nr:hypothetical protein [Bacilli bacterium]
MSDESLIQVLGACIDTICELKIDNADKIELLINIRNFLMVDKYKRNIDILQKEEYKLGENKRYK